MRLSLLLPAAGLLPQAFAQLNTLAKAKGWEYFGSATDNGELTDTSYTAILSDNTEFGQITPGNTQKWDTTEPTQGTFSFTKGDVVTAFAAANSQKLRCHTLVWYSQLPSWVSGGTWTNQTLIAVMQNHIKEVVTHYKGQCYAWDVVNEAFNEDGTYRTSVFYNVIGPEYIPIAFATAALYDDTAKLYYNDYNIENAGGKSTAALNVVKTLKARGIKIDGVGMQAHFIVGSTPSLSAQTTNLESFTAEGVEVAYTELDIRHASIPASTAALATQSTDYVNTVNACLAVTGCVGITIWDFTDKYSWIPSVFSGAGEACLYNEDLSKKPAYTAVVAALGGSSSSATTKAAAEISTSAPVSVSTVAPTTLVTSAKATSAVASSSSAVIATSVVSSSAPAATTASSSTGSGTVAFWGQCGGTGFTGATTCVEGATCVVQNPYYSQCLS